MKVTCIICSVHKDKADYYATDIHSNGKEGTCKKCRGEKIRRKRLASPQRVGFTDMLYLNLFVGDKNALPLYF